MQSRQRYTAATHATARFVAQHLLLKPVLRTVTKVRIHGRDRLSGLEGGYVVVSNHSSHLDAPLLMTSLPYRLSRLLATGVAMDYFYSSPVRSLPTKLFFNSYPIDRSGSGAHRGLSGRLLGDGVPILIFPEGTRSKTGKMAKFNPGAASLAIANDVPIIPTALVGAGAAMPRDSSWPRAGRPTIDVVFGTPLLPGPGENARKFTERLSQTVQSLHDAKAVEIGKPTLEAYARGEASLADPDRMPKQAEPNEDDEQPINPGELP